MKPDEIVEHFLPNDPQTVTEIMEHSKKEHMLVELFESLVERKQYERARRIAWWLNKEFSIDVGLFEDYSSNYA